MNKSSPKNTYIVSRKIRMFPVIDEENPEKRKEKQDEIYSYFRDAIWAQNRAFNLLTSAVYTGLLCEKSEEYIEDIYFRYSHQAPKEEDCAPIRTLRDILKCAPVTEEVITARLNARREYLLSQKKPPKEKTLQKKLDSLETDLRKYMGVPKEEIEAKIAELENWCAYPADVYNKFANCLSTPAYVTQQVRQYWKEFSKDVLSGKAAVRNMKLTSPLILPPFVFYDARSGILTGLRHPYAPEHFAENILHNRNVELDLLLPYKKGEEKVRFRLILGGEKNSMELRHVIKNIFEGVYTIKGSKIGFTRNRKTGKDTDITLFLSIEMPKTEMYLDENTVVGVDLGIQIPAVCAVNNDDTTRLSIGSAEEFICMRTRMQSQRNRIQRSLRLTTSGGHGRQKKLSHMERFSEYESNWVDTYNHNASKKIVDFAIRNHAKYINVENLEGFGENDRDSKSKDIILRNWSYYQLQQYITYKAAKYGIIVRKVNPYHTSQRCSRCGHEDPANRPKGEKGQAYFKCTKCGYDKNADFNAARNIAMSTEFQDGKTTVAEKKKQHEEAAS